MARKRSNKKQQTTGISQAHLDTFLKIAYKMSREAKLSETFLIKPNPGYLQTGSPASGLRVRMITGGVLEGIDPDGTMIAADRLHKVIGPGKGSVDLHVRDHKLTIRCPDGVYVDAPVSHGDPTEHPSTIDAFEKADQLVFAGKISRDDLSWLSRSVSTDEMRQSLNVIYVSKVRGPWEMVSTDGRRIHILQVNNTEETQITDGVSLPRPLVQYAIQVMRTGDPEQIEIYRSKGKEAVTLRMSFPVAVWEITSIDTDLGPFPDYKQVIPEDPPTATMQIEGQSFAKEIRSLATRFESPRIKLLLTDDHVKVEVFTDDPEVIGHKVLDLGQRVEYNGQHSKSDVQLNPKYLVEAIDKAVGEITVKLIDYSDYRITVIEIEQPANGTNGRSDADAGLMDDSFMIITNPPLYPPFPEKTRGVKILNSPEGIFSSDQRCPGWTRSEQKRSGRKRSEQWGRDQNRGSLPRGKTGEKGGRVKKGRQGTLSSGPVDTLIHRTNIIYISPPLPSGSGGEVYIHIVLNIPVYARARPTTKIRSGRFTSCGNWGFTK